MVWGISSQRFPVLHQRGPTAVPRDSCWSSIMSGFKSKFALSFSLVFKQYNYRPFQIGHSLIVHMQTPSRIKNSLFGSGKYKHVTKNKVSKYNPETSKRVQKHDILLYHQKGTNDPTKYAFEAHEQKKIKEKKQLMLGSNINKPFPHSTSKECSYFILFFFFFLFARPSLNDSHSPLILMTSSEVSSFSNNSSP